MLVLSRKRDEKILLQIGDEETVELTVVRIDANKVRLGIQASESVTILRKELLNDDPITVSMGDALQKL